MRSCIFCKIAAGHIGAWKVFENTQVYAFFDIHPANRYHTLIIPKQHFESIFAVPEKDFVEVMKVARSLAHLYHDRLGLSNLQIVHSSGRDAQQDVPHFHVHLVPRSAGDGQDIQWKTHPEWVSEFDVLRQSLGEV